MGSGSKMIDYGDWGGLASNALIGYESFYILGNLKLAGATFMMAYSGMKGL